MSEHYLDIVRQVLDRQVVDANHFNCGKVDDIEIDFHSKTPTVTAILVGNQYSSDRLPEFAKWISQKLFGRSRVKLSWSEVTMITENVKLAKNADEYGLDERNGLVYKFISKLPGAWRK